MENLKETLIALYLDWVNNYLTLETFAEHHGISKSHAYTLINRGKELYKDRLSSNLEVSLYIMPAAFAARTEST